MLLKPNNCLGYEMKIIYRDELQTEHHKIMINGLNHNAYVIKELGKNNGSFSFTIENSPNYFAAGISGFNYYGCFHIDLLFVTEEARRKGYGSILIKEAEKLAEKRKCRFITVNTMDFEAKPFYEKLGYKVEFIREGFDKGVKMYFLKKYIL